MSALLWERTAHMEYYAKSKRKSLSLEQINEMKNILQCMIEKLDEYFTESEIDILNYSIKNISKTSEEKQKTLKEHHEDIVKCAEMFFYNMENILLRKKRDW